MNLRHALAASKPDIIRAFFAEADTMTIRIFAALLFAFALAACGQSGPLYVPGDPSSVEQAQPVPQNGDENDENGEEEDN